MNIIDWYDCGQIVILQNLYFEILSLCSISRILLYTIYLMFFVFYFNFRVRKTQKKKY